MATDKKTATAALAKEVRRTQVQARVLRHKAELDSTANIARLVSEMNQLALANHERAKKELEDDTEPSVLESFGSRSTLDDALRAERAIGKAAGAKYIRGNPTCSPEDVVQAWVVAVGTHAQDPAVLLNYYQAKLKALGVLPDLKWETYRQWVLDAPWEQVVGGE